MEKIRVLHIFGPKFKQRFGGPIFDWKYAFSKWDDPSVEHLVWDEGKVEPALQAFNFDMNANQTMSTRWQRIAWIFQLLFSLRKHKKEYDVLHFHVLLWGGLLATAWGKRNKIPTIYQSVLQGSDTPESIKQELFGNLKLRLLNLFSLIIAISDQLRLDYINCGFPTDKVVMLMNSVDTDLFRPPGSPTDKKTCREQFSIPINSKILLFTGSIIKRKGIDFLIEAFLQIAPDHPNLYLWLVGPASQKENASLDKEFIIKMKNQVSRAKLTDRVRFHGMIYNRSELSEAYQAADIFVFSSRNEGLPNAVLEAMACELPVIVSDLPGLKNVIKSDYNGAVVPIGGVEALAEAILALAEDEERSASLGRNARSYIQSVHGFDAWQKEISAYYHKLETERLLQDAGITFKEEKLE